MRPIFSKLLVANRGEIACRVMRTAKRLNIQTVALYSEPDAMAPHVRMADEAICLGGTTSAESYLKVDSVIAALKATGAEAVHPGYGFLSENQAFADAVEAAGAAFVGPSAFAISAMGDKIESKRLAASAGVSTIPGVESIIKDAEEAVQIANEVGYPVMLKASAGGGGKGMRIAYNDAEARSGFELSAAEAASSFGDDRIFVERYVEQPRHVEIQLIADKHGNCVYLPPRDCSIQRRNQKVVEEAPAPHLSEATVKAMGEEAVALAKAVGYSSAGTVEYLVDAQQRHYFLEMNTRLQVEHPVTEEVTGIDLVEMMLRSAAGEVLPIKQEDVIQPNGWSFECRIYAEDPLRGFLPSVGTLTTYRPPDQATCVAAAEAAIDALSSSSSSSSSSSASAAAEASYIPHSGAPAEEIADKSRVLDGRVRIDGGIVEGGEISVYYDPMISKLITHAPTRDMARLLMLQALDRYVIHGVRHNINFCRSLLDHPRFARGDVTTAFIPEEFPDGYDGHVMTTTQREDLLACSAALQFAFERRRRLGIGAKDVPSPSSMAQASYQIQLDGGDTPDASTASSDTVSIAIDANFASSTAPLLPAEVVFHIAGFSGSSSSEGGGGGGGGEWSRSLKLLRTGLGPDAIMEGRFGDRPMAVQVNERKALGWSVSAFGTTYEVLARSERAASLSAYMKPPPRSELDDALLSPMPGTLIALKVAEGEAVVMGQDLCVVEAMKMQNVLTASRDGVVKTLLAQQGATLAADQPIIAFEQEGGEEEADLAAAAA